MSDPKLISPLLDGFVMGGPISDHDGIRCCPAMKENSDSKYIVKIIAIPASQVQLDALLLTGAYKDPAAALDYFKSLSEDVVAEAKALQDLTQLGGFAAFEGWQIVPMENNCLGYEVYLLSAYQRTLDKFMRRNGVSHLAAVNLGLDLCTALSTARSAGYLYADVKPSNIFVSDDREFTIGDLGLVKLDSLKYASLPGKYRSDYTAPELLDDLATIGETTDIYAVGMILYQIYNNGQLPTQAKTENHPLPSPLNADYEIAEVIMKAIAPDARDRWQTPDEMGQALASYMQRNTVTDDPICPPLAPIAETADSRQNMDILSPAEPEEADETVPGDEDILMLESETVSQEVNTMLAEAQEQIDQPLSAATIAVGSIQIPQPVDPVVEDSTESKTPVLEESDQAANDDRRTMVVSTGLSQKNRKSMQIFDDEDDYYEEEEDYPSEAVETDLPADNQGTKKKFRPLLLLITAVLLCALICGGYYFYRNYYLLEINELDVSGIKNQIVVTVDTEIDESMLIVVCSDTYGNTKRMKLTNGQAVFTDLTPDTVYKIQLEVSGFHKLSGPYYGSHITAAETKIEDFTGVTGTEDGSVVLSFRVSGPEKTPDWTVTYSAEGEETVTVPFTGHNVTITGLTIGKDYTFQLNPTSDELYMVGENTLVFTASQIIIAEDLKITACAEGNLTAQWAVPEGVTVEGWNVRCYSQDGVESTTTVTEPSVTFTDIQAGTAYTVEVTAVGMTQSVRTSVSTNPITVTDITVEDTDPETLTITWNFEGDAPEGGWLLLYTLDNSETPEVVRCDTTTAIISPRVPGASYHLEIQTVAGTTVFMDEFVYECPEAEAFINNEYKLPSTHINANLLVTPKENWSYHDVSGKRDYTDTFQVGDSISLLMRATVNSFYLPADATNILYVIRDSEGNVIQNLVKQETIDWCDIWNNDDFHYGELDLPAVPTEIGEYTVTVYFNGYQVCQLPFSITE